MVKFIRIVLIFVCLTFAFLNNNVVNANRNIPLLEEFFEQANMYSNVNGNEKERIRELFSKHETILNDYFIEYKRNSSDKLYRQDAVSIIYSSAKGLSYSINPFILIVLMELKSNAITNPDFKKEDLDYIMGVTDEEYREYLGISKEKSDIKSNSLQRQLTWIGNELDIDKSINNEENIIKSADSLYNVLKFLSENENELNKWVSNSEGSFYHLYNKMFPDKQIPIPISKKYLSKNNNEDNKFLIEKPFAGVYNINSFFDHLFPIYKSEVEKCKKRDLNNVCVEYHDNKRDYFVNFLGDKKVGSNLSSCVLGISCYSGHNGVDYQMVQEELISPYDGIVDEISECISENIPCKANLLGNAVYLKHDVNDDDIFDYMSSFLHLNEISVEEGDVIKAGDIIGVSGNSGTSSGGAHLHFDVSIINEIGNKRVDPFGWWGDETDPWEEINGTKSHYLWKSSDVVDDLDNGFQHFNNSKYPWIEHIIPENNTTDKAYNNRAIYTHALMNTGDNFIKWDNWGFWGAEFEEGKAGKYKVQVYVPKIEIKKENGDVEKNSARVMYKIFYSDENDETKKLNEIVSFDQEHNQGGWFTIGNEDGYYCREYDSCALMLVDEIYLEDSSNSYEKGKAEEEKLNLVWADAVRWVVDEFKYNYNYKIDKHPDGTLVKLSVDVEGEDSNKVYLLKNGSRHWIPNESIFKAYHGNNWDNIISIVYDEMKNYPLGNDINYPNGTVLALEEDGFRYLVFNDNNILKLDVLSLVNLGYNNQQTTKVSRKYLEDNYILVTEYNSELNPNKTLIRFHDGSEIYKIENNNVLHLISDGNILNSYGYSLGTTEDTFKYTTSAQIPFINPVKKVNYTFSTSSENIKYANGTLFKVTENNEIIEYSVVSNGGRVLFSDQELMEKLGYEKHKVVEISNNEVQNFPVTYSFSYTAEDNQVRLTSHTQFSDEENVGNPKQTVVGVKGFFQKIYLSIKNINTDFIKKISEFSFQNNTRSVRSNSYDQTISWEVPDVSNGEYTLQLIGIDSYGNEVLVSGEDFTISGSNDYKINGYVKDLEGTGISNLKINFYNESNKQTYQYVYTDNNGYYTSTKLDKGNYIVSLDMFNNEYETDERYKESVILKEDQRQMLVDDFVLNLKEDNKCIFTVSTNRSVEYPVTIDFDASATANVLPADAYDIRYSWGYKNRSYKTIDENFFSYEYTSEMHYATRLNVYYKLPGSEETYMLNPCYQGITIGYEDNQIEIQSVGSEVWTNNNVYIVKGNELIISEGTTLKIEPGTIVKSKPNGNRGTLFEVNGTLEADGVIFTSYYDDNYGGDSNKDAWSTVPAIEDWIGFNVGENGKLILKNSKILYAGKPYLAFTGIYWSTLSSGVINNNKGYVELLNNEFIDSKGGVSIKNSLYKNVIKNNKFNSSYIRVENGYAEIDGNNFEQTHISSVRVYDMSGYINNNTFHTSTDKNILIDLYKSNPEINNNTVNIPNNLIKIGDINNELNLYNNNEGFMYQFNSEIGNNGILNINEGVNIYAERTRTAIENKGVLNISGEKDNPVKVHLFNVYYNDTKFILNNENGRSYLNYMEMENPLDRSVYGVYQEGGQVQINNSKFDNFKIGLKKSESIQPNIIKNSEFKNMYSGSGVYFDRVNVNINNCKFSDMSIGIYVSSTTGEITDNTFSNVDIPIKNYSDNVYLNNNINLTANKLPTANAGINQIKIVGETVVLDASSSYDPEGSSLTYKWQQVSGDYLNLDLTQKVLSWTAQTTGEYGFSLIVNDGEDDSFADEVHVTININTNEIVSKIDNLVNKFNEIKLKARQLHQEANKNVWQELWDGLQNLFENSFFTV